MQHQFLGMSMRHMTSGFTLVEMIVTMAIMAILLSFAVPSYTSTVSSSRMSGEINNLLGSLNLARSEAIKRGLTVSVSPQAGAVCATTATPTNWSTGWYVLLDSTAQQLQVSPALSHGDTLNSTLNTFPCFTPAGYTFYTGTISLHDSTNNSSLTRCIQFSSGSYKTVRGGTCP